MRPPEDVKLCVVCWKDSFATEARWYLSTIPVCDEHQQSVCARCRRQWAAWYAETEEGDRIYACDACSEEMQRLAARRDAYNEHLASNKWRKMKKQARSQSFRELGKIACSRCGISERDNRQTYGEGLHGHHKTYQRFGKEVVQDIELLCSKCHASEHHLPAPKPL